MAFLNMVRSGTYSTIMVIYDKQNRLLDVRLQVWENESKQQLLTEIPYMFHGVRKHLEVDSLISKIPETLNQNESYLVCATESPDLPPNTIYQFEPNSEEWRAYPVLVGQIIYVHQLGKHLQRVDGPPEQAWIEANEEMDLHIWDRWFRPDLIGGVDESGEPLNILRAAYEFLKTLPEFSNIENG